MVNCRGPALKPSFPLFRNVSCQMLGKEPHHAESRLSPIRLLPEAMPFIGEQQVLYRHAALPERSHNLLCFDNGYVGVVGTMLHHNCGLNAIEFVDR